MKYPTSIATVMLTPNHLRELQGTADAVRQQLFLRLSVAGAPLATTRRVCDDRNFDLRLFCGHRRLRVASKASRVHLRAKLLRVGLPAVPGGRLKGRARGLHGH